MDQKDIITYSIIIVSIIITIYFIKNKKQNRKENYSAHVENIYLKDNYKYEPLEDKIKDNYKYIIEGKKCNKKKKRVHFADEAQGCKNVVLQSPKEFQKDFFNFRDKIEHNSSMRFDPVDKITAMYLDDNKRNDGKNKKIKDVFDEITKAPVNLYTRSCVRVPQFDNVNPEKYEILPGTPGLHMVRDEWKYDNENILNGGQVGGNIYPHEDFNTNNFELDMYDN